MKVSSDYWRDKAVDLSKDNIYIATFRGHNRPRNTTIGLYLLVKWADGSLSWIPFKDLKESYPCETDESSKSRGISYGPAFASWVPYTLQKYDITISKVKYRIRKTTQKYGIEVLTSVNHSLEIYRNIGNKLSRDALDKDMTKVVIYFEVLEEGIKATIGCIELTGHLVWYAKMNITCKERWVLGGHKNIDPIWFTYYRVLSRESVHFFHLCWLDWTGYF